MRTIPNPRQARSNRLSFSEVLLILTGAAFWPWNVVSQNPQEIVRPGRVVGLVILSFSLAMAIAIVLVKRGARGSTVAMSSFVWLVLFMVGGRLIQQLGQVIGWAAVVAVAAGVPVLLSRWESHAFARSLIAAVAVLVVAGPAIASVQAILEWGESEVLESEFSPVVLDQRPDIVLLLLDGHPGSIAWDQDFRDRAPIFDGLVDRGFDAPESSWSPYWTTHYSLSALFNMQYVLNEQPEATATDAHLYRIVSGENSLTRTLRANGYSVSALGSGWSGLRCTRAFDNCHDAPLVDDVLFFMLKDSLLGRYLTSSLGHAYTHGVSEAMHQLPDLIEAISSNESPDFLMAHLIAPHPPTFFTPQCDVQVTPSRLGVAAGPWGVDQDVWDAYFLEQARCIDGFVLSVVDMLPPDTIVVVVSDHGTDRRGQSVGVDWNTDATIERLNVVVGLRSGATACSIESPIVLPNLFRTVLACLSGESIPHLDPVLFINPITPVPEDEVSRLLGLSSG